jgi:hypothetical protein
LTWNEPILTPEAFLISNPSEFLQQRNLEEKMSMAAIDWDEKAGG